MDRERSLEVVRRSVVTGLVSVAAGVVLAKSAMSEERPSLTPEQMEGPFYPLDWRGDIDNDLVRVHGEAAQAMGQVLHVEGRVLRVDGQPVPGCRLEIWQCDSQGIYRHPDDTGASRQSDPQFQGRGRTETNASGRYAFRTIKPVPYPGRTPHIHFRLDTPQSSLTTQMYVFGEPLNERDGLLRSIRDPRARESVIVRLEPADGREAGALAGMFDIVVA